MLSCKDRPNLLRQGLEESFVYSETCRLSSKANSLPLQEILRCILDSSVRAEHESQS